jgi:hypothetical protein
MALNQKKLKPQIIESLRQHRMVEFALQKLGVPRQTYYRWRKEDSEFTEQCDEARQIGTDRLNDVAETGLASRLKDSLANQKYWLEHHHPDYKPRMRAPAEQHPRNEDSMPVPILGGISRKENLEIYQQLMEWRKLTEQERDRRLKGLIDQTGDDIIKAKQKG